MQDSVSGKLMDHVLSRLDELPTYAEMTLGEDGVSEKEEEQTNPMETEENNKKGKIFI